MAGLCELRTGSPDETRLAGEALGRLLEGGDYVCLYGELGAGKTTFVQGMARGLDVAERYVTSPSFALVNEYEGRLKLYHIDLYRLGGPDELSETGFSEYPDGGVAALEWPERAGENLPAERLEVSIVHGGGGSRTITVRAVGARYGSLLEALCRNTPWRRP